MVEQKRSPRELNQNSQDSEQQSNQNSFIKNPRGKLYLSKSYLLKRYKLKRYKLLTRFLLKPSIREKTAWDWLKLVFAPASIALIAGLFTYCTDTKHNQILEQSEKAEENRNQQALLIKYIDDISKLVENGLLTLNGDKNSKTQRIIARARTFSVLRALDSDRKGQLIKFLSVAKLIEVELDEERELKNKPIIDLNEVDLEEANLKKVKLKKAYLEEANLQKAYLEDANLQKAYLEDANLERAKLKEAYLVEANLEDGNLMGANLENANLWDANLMGADLKDANLKDANLKDADLRSADLWDANLKDADLGYANLRFANLMGANLEDANLITAIGLNPTEVKTACNWEKALFSQVFKQKLDQKLDQQVDCSRWNWDW